MPNCKIAYWFLNYELEHAFHKTRSQENKSNASGGGFRREGGADAFLFWGFAPLSNQRNHPLYYFEYPFWLTDPKSFLKAPSAQMFNNFEGTERAGKTQILGEMRAGNLRKESAPEKRKCLKTRFDLFFWQKFWLRRKNIRQIRVEIKKIIVKNFPKIPPSSRKS